MKSNKVYEMSVAKVLPLLVNKATKKGRTREEVYEVISWLTGYQWKEIDQAIVEEWTYQDFFERAPAKNPKRKLIKGVVCGVRVEDIEDQLMQDIRYLDKMIDELAKGKTLDRILRS